MNVEELLGAARDAITVKRVYAEPYEKDGVTVIPAAAVAGGGGGGQGTRESEEGQGAGFGMSGRPVGVYVLSEGRLSWRPAIDVNRLVTAVSVVMVAFLVSRSRIKRAKIRAAAREG